MMTVKVLRALLIATHEPLNKMPKHSKTSLEPCACIRFRRGSCVALCDAPDFFEACVALNMHEKRKPEASQRSKRGPKAEGVASSKSRVRVRSPPPPSPPDAPKPQTLTNQGFSRFQLPHGPLRSWEMKAPRGRIMPLVAHGAASLLWGEPPAGCCLFGASKEYIGGAFGLLCARAGPLASLLLFVGQILS